MKGEEGVTLAEVLVALVILSLLAASLSGIIQNLLGNWERTSERIKNVEHLTSYSDNISTAEQQTISGEPFTLTSDDGQTLILAMPKTDKTAACIYDLVGRRCR